MTDTTIPTIHIHVSCDNSSCLPDADAVFPEITIKGTPLSDGEKVKVANLLWSLYKKRNRSMSITTTSEIIILFFLWLVRTNELDKDKLVIHWWYKNKEKIVNVTEDGDLPGSIAGGFFSDRDQFLF